MSTPSYLQGENHYRTGSISSDVWTTELLQNRHEAITQLTEIFTHDNEVTLLSGPNGCGKTSLVEMLAETGLAGKRGAIKSIEGLTSREDFIYGLDFDKLGRYPTASELKAVFSGNKAFVAFDELDALLLAEEEARNEFAAFIATLKAVDGISVILISRRAEDAYTDTVRNLIDNRVTLSQLDDYQRPTYM